MNRNLYRNLPQPQTMDRQPKRNLNHFQMPPEYIIPGALQQPAAATPPTARTPFIPPTDEHDMIYAKRNERIVQDHGDYLYKG
jgi:hypothetical protein